MKEQRRRKFFIKGNFQINFILGFILLLFTEVLLTAVIIYQSSYSATEKAMYKSHLVIEKSSQIIGPIILKVNLWVILASIVFAGIAAIISYSRYCAFFEEIIRGLKNLKDNNTSFRIKSGGGMNTRELIKDFNHAAAYLDKRQAGLKIILDALSMERELKNIEKLHIQLCSIIAEKSHE